MDSHAIGKLWQHSLVAMVAVLATGCGGGGGSAPDTRTPIAPAPPVIVPLKYAVGGTVTGLGPGAALTLTYGSEKLSIGANGSFVFPNKVDAGTAYSITAAAPAGHTCRVSDGAGVVAADVSKVAVACAPVVLAGAVGTLQLPLAVEGDGAGNLYVVDGLSASVLKVSAAGTVTVVAGMRGQPGYVDGPGASARFGFGRGDLMVDGLGNLLVADGCNNVIRKIKPDGDVSTLATGLEPTCRIGPLMTAGRPLQPLTSPNRIIPDGAGGAIVLDAINNGSVVKLSATGVPGIQSWSNPTPLQGSLLFTALARGTDGILYLADTRARIWKDVAGTLVLVAGGASGGPRDGAGSAAGFRRINDMAVGPNGDLYVADASQVRKVTPAGVVTTVAGGIGVRPGTDGQGAAAGFGQLRSLTPDGPGLVVVDDSTGGLRRVGFDGAVSTLAATPEVRGTVDGVGSVARFNSAFALAADADGNLYTADQGTSLVRKITPEGNVTTFTGRAGEPGVSDGTLASATFSSPHAVAAGRDGTLWVAQIQGLRKIQNGMVTTVLPSQYINELAVDSDGNAVIVDDMMQVLRVSPTGQTSVLVSGGDVIALLKNANAEFMPEGLAADAAGNLYIADRGTAVVYKLAKSGELSVFAGTPMKDQGNVDGAVGTATLGFYGYAFLTIDDKGNLYISGQGKVRMISPAGVVSTPNLDWGTTPVMALAYAKGKLYGLARYALLQSYL